MAASDHGANPESKRAPHRTPRMWVLAGANGSGNSTFYQLMLEPRGVRWINADDIARTMWPADPEGHSYAAAAVAAEQREAAVRAGIDFATETVFSHPSKLVLLHNARAAGYHVTLVYIHLASAELNVARVAQRVAQGGHNVPQDKIIARRARVQTLMGEAIAAADEAVILDNSDDDNPFVVVARVSGGVVTYQADGLPPDVTDVLATVRNLGR